MRTLIVRYEIVKTFDPTVVIENAEICTQSLIDAIEMAESRCRLIRILNETGGWSGKEPVNEELLAIRVGSVKILENVG